MAKRKQKKMEKVLIKKIHSRKKTLRKNTYCKSQCITYNNNKNILNFEKNEFLFEERREICFF